MDGSVRFGIPALAATFTAAAIWECGVMGTPARRLLADLGFGRPTWSGVRAAMIVSAAIIAYYPIYSSVSAPLPLQPGWMWLAVGLFAYHGLAEELAWRGYAFRRIREGRTFASAVLLTMPLIAVTHIPIVLSMGPLVGGAAVVVAAITCLPLAYLWECGGRTIWGPALVHASIDVFKLVETPTGDQATSFSLGLAAVSIIVPLLAFVLCSLPVRQAQ